MKRIRLLNEERGLEVLGEFDKEFMEDFISNLSKLPKDSYERSEDKDWVVIRTYQLKTFEEIMFLIKWSSSRYYKNFYETTDRNGDTMYIAFEDGHKELFR